MKLKQTIASAHLVQSKYEIRDSSPVCLLLFCVCLFLCFSVYFVLMQPMAVVFSHKRARSGHETLVTATAAAVHCYVSTAYSALRSIVNECVNC